MPLGLLLVALWQLMHLLGSYKCQERPIPTSGMPVPPCPALPCLALPCPALPCPAGVPALPLYEGL